MSPQRVRRIARLLTLAGFLVGIAYLYGRYDLMTLPSAGCSPLYNLDPGDRLLLDRRPPQLAPGHSVLFADPDGRLLLGQVSDAVAVSAQELWILTQDPNCPGADSRQFGPVPKDRVRARVLFPLP